jgi:isocitrate dehydrogenase (NAD+)
LRGVSFSTEAPESTRPGVLFQANNRVNGEYSATLLTRGPAGNTLPPLSFWRIATMTSVTLVRGDGIGPEIAEAARRCIDATGAEINWDVVDAGTDVMEREGTPLPQKTIDSIIKTGVALKAPITTPVGTGFRSINVHLRQTLDLYACLRPCKSYKGVRSRYTDIDLVVVRENTEDCYAGIEFEKGEDDTAELINWINSHGDRKIRKDSGITIKPISVHGTERIVTFAFDYARRIGRRKVTSVHKANIMKYTDGLWLDVSRQVAKKYPDIEFEDRIVDNMCMQLIQKPELYDVIVLPNLYGDILSDLCAGLVGGLGVAPGANIGEKGAIFEATHGSAPKYKGQNKVNPTALILSGVMMLRHLGKMAEADKLENAVAAVIAEGKSVTYDMKPDRKDPTAVGTSQMADAIIEKIKLS